MASLNDKFLAKYNQLDFYVKRLGNIKKGSGIYVLIKVLDPERASELNTIRQIKNANFSHNGIVGQKLQINNDFMNALTDIFNYVRQNENKIKNMIIAYRGKSKNDDKQNESKNTKKPKKGKKDTSKKENSTESKQTVKKVVKKSKPPFAKIDLNKIKSTLTEAISVSVKETNGILNSVCCTRIKNKAKSIYLELNMAKSVKEMFKIFKSFKDAMFATMNNNGYFGVAPKKRKIVENMLKTIRKKDLTILWKRLLSLTKEEKAIKYIEKARNGITVSVEYSEKEWKKYYRAFHSQCINCLAHIFDSSTL